MKYAHLAARIFATPLMIAPDKARVILAAIGDRFDLHVESLTPVQLETMEQRAFGEIRTEDGVAIIPVTGTLVNRAHGLNALSGLTSYAGLADLLLDAGTDPQVTGILLDIDSPGGEVSGLFDLVDTLQEVREMKPVFAVANDHALSAAYAIASAADRLYVTRTGAVGSVGVIAVHVDESTANEQMGLTYTVVRAGAFKAEHNPYEPLTEHAQTSLQGEVDRVYGMFTALIAGNRGLAIHAVKATEAQVYHGENGVSAGLADQVGNAHTALAALRDERTKTTLRGVVAHNEMEDRMEAKETTRVATEEGHSIDVEKITTEAKQQGRAEHQAEVRQITELCSIAGMEHLAHGFIADGQPIDLVRQGLLERRADPVNAETEIASGHDAVPDRPEAQDPSPRIDVADIYTRLNSANAVAA